MALFSLEGKTAVVTGAGKGIGKSISLLFAQQGANIALVDMDENAVKEVKSAIEELGRKAEYYICDVSNQNQALEMINSMATTFGTLDILVNNAGVAHIGTVETTNEEDFDRLFRINVKGVYNFMKGVIPYMHKGNGGSIINMASIVSAVGIPDRFAYSMTKGAVLTMTLSVAKDYVQKGIRCNCISPGRVHTPFVDDFLKKTYPGKEQEMFAKLAATQPMGRMGSPDEIAHLALYLASDESGFVTGCNYAIDGGFIHINN